MHKCLYEEFEIPFSGYGPAIIYCIEDERKFHVGNDEFENSVNYCPFCGEKAPEQSIELKTNASKSPSRLNAS